MKIRVSGVLRFFRILLLIAGSFFLLLCLLALTTIPFKAYYNLGIKADKVTTPPQAIVLLSGMGIPSEGGLLRAYYAARIAKDFPELPVIISMPGDLTYATSAPRLTASEIMIRGIDSLRIKFENTGRNTREQASKLTLKPIGLNPENPVILVTAPEHMRRAVLTFKKLGFKHVYGKPTFEVALGAADLTYTANEVKGNNYVPSVGNNLQVRYQFWSHLKLEVMVIREYLGLAYYKLRGWI